MINLTEILQKELRAENNTHGIAENLLFDNFTRTCLMKTKRGIFVISKVEPTEGYVAVCAQPFENGQLSKSIEKKQFLHSLTIGQKIFDQNGLKVGEVADVELTDKLVLKRLLIDNGTSLQRGDIVAVGDVVISKAKAAKRTVADQLREERAAELPTDSAKDNLPNNVVTVATRTQAETSNKTIRRKYGDFSFLIGKSVDKTIVNFQGEVMIKQHETINVDILRQAKVSGKLLELYLHIK